MSNQVQEIAPEEETGRESAARMHLYYKIRFREGKQIYTAGCKIPHLKAGETVMLQSDHGLEPALVLRLSAQMVEDDPKIIQADYSIARRANADEVARYASMVEREIQAFASCQKWIANLGMAMKLIDVERYFNGSKIIFFFTAENRVDFRELVKDLVQEFRTRVEMRQVGVRHETKMIGGLGCCGRELCCSSFMTKFLPVSIKMAKEQDLPLNPSKISGICNRLLCCLTHEYATYRSIKKVMPKAGKSMVLKGVTYRVLQQNVLRETLTVVAADNEENPIIMAREEWEGAEVLLKPNKRPASGAAGGDGPAVAAPLLSLPAAAPEPPPAAEPVKGAAPSGAGNPGGRGKPRAKPREGKDGRESRDGHRLRGAGRNRRRTD